MNMLSFDLSKMQFEQLEMNKMVWVSVQKSEYSTKKLLKHFQKYSLIRLKNIKNYSIPADEIVKCRFNDRDILAVVTRFSLSSHGSLVYSKNPVYELKIELLDFKFDILKWFKRFRKRA